ncbi:hypothetical protein ACPCG0_09770 [Propionibacteriaceae bacterium Y1923]
MESEAVKRTSRGPLVLLLVLALLVGAGAAIGVSRAISSFGSAPLELEVDDRDTRIVESITRKEQVVLLSLGIQGIAEQTQATKVFGVRIPGSSRATFVQYNFHAKLGIEGSDVEIDQTGDDEYTITIPEFIFIGHDKESFRLVTENNGVLSVVTPEIDPVEVINNILNDDAKNEYVAANQEILRDQARLFYEGIITSIDPNLTVKFAFNSR